MNDNTHTHITREAEKKENECIYIYTVLKHITKSFTLLKCQLMVFRCAFYNRSHSGLAVLCHIVLASVRRSLWSYLYLITTTSLHSFCTQASSVVPLGASYRKFHTNCKQQYNWACKNYIRSTFYGTFEFRAATK